MLKNADSAAKMSQFLSFICTSKEKKTFVRNDLKTFKNV
jgi:hypothetical protein